MVSREWKNGSNSSFNYTSFFHSLLTKGKNAFFSLGLGCGVEEQRNVGFYVSNAEETVLWVGYKRMLCS